MIIAVYILRFLMVVFAPTLTHALDTSNRDVELSNEQVSMKLLDLDALKKFDTIGDFIKNGCSDKPFDKYIICHGALGLLSLRKYVPEINVVHIKNSIRENEYLISFLNPYNGILFRQLGLRILPSFSLLFFNENLRIGENLYSNEQIKINDMTVGMAVAFDELFEYEDKNNNGLYDDGEYSEYDHQTIHLGDAEWGQTSNSCASMERDNFTINASTIDGTFGLKVNIPTKMALDNTKYDISIADFPYKKEGTNLALKMYFASAKSELSHFEQTSLAFNTTDPNTYISWNARSIANSDTTKVNMRGPLEVNVNNVGTISLFTLSKDAKAYESYASFEGVHPKKIFWKPEVEFGEIITKENSNREKANEEKENKEREEKVKEEKEKERKEKKELEVKMKEEKEKEQKEKKELEVKMKEEKVNKELEESKTRENEKNKEKKKQDEGKSFASNPMIYIIISSCAVPVVGIVIGIAFLKKSRKAKKVITESKLDAECTYDSVDPNLTNYHNVKQTNNGLTDVCGAYGCTDTVNRNLHSQSNGPIGYRDNLYDECSPYICSDVGKQYSSVESPEIPDTPYSHYVPLPDVEQNSINYMSLTESSLSVLENS